MIVKKLMYRRDDLPMIPDLARNFSFEEDYEETREWLQLQMVEPDDGVEPDHARVVLHRLNAAHDIFLASGRNRVLMPYSWIFVTIGISIYVMCYVAPTDPLWLRLICFAAGGAGGMLVADLTWRAWRRK